jgi:hypothetical protein
MKLAFLIIFVSITIFSCQSEGKVCGTSISIHDSMYNNRFISKYILLNKNSICLEDYCALISEIWLEEQWSCKGQDPPLNKELKQLIIKFKNPVPNYFLMDYTILNKDPNMSNRVFYFRTRFLIATYIKGLPDTLTYCVYKGDMPIHGSQELDTLVFVKQDDDFN